MIFKNQKMYLAINIHIFVCLNFYKKKKKHFCLTVLYTKINKNIG